MNEDPAYLQFPLCALAFGDSVEMRLEHIISHAMIEAGGKCWADCDHNRQGELIDRWHSDDELAGDRNLNNESHLAALMGGEVLKIASGSMKATFRRRNKLHQFITEFESKHGHSSTVRIWKTLAFEARDGKGMTYREFAILAAIRSVIGRKTRPVLITIDAIERRSMGYKTKKVMDVELPRREDGQSPWTHRELRYAVNKLHQRELFKRCTFANRLTYYSTRLSHEELRKAVIELKTGEANSSHVQKDQDMTDQIKKIRKLKAQNHE